MNTTEFSTETTPEESLLAAIDLGSNSFHMVVARLFQGELTAVDIMSEKVQLAAGMDADKNLSAEAIDRGIECLKRFAQRISALPRESIKVVGTNALREAENSSVFAELAEKVLRVPLEIIAGREEARLIYLGVSHTLANASGARLVVDIGGGSTEVIIGENFESTELESLHMGCVSYSQRYFANGLINEANLKKAERAARQELLSIQKRYKAVGWSSSVGSSGTIKALRNASVSLGYSEELLTRASLDKLKKDILKFESLDDIVIEGVKPERAAILPAGLAILTALMDALEIDEMAFSDGALREGLLYDMAGRLRHEDVRERSISALSQRYHVDSEHADRVEKTALLALAQVKNSWNLEKHTFHDMLSWAARTHEIGLTISHSQFHRHSAYLLQHSDLSGFSKLEQQLLSFLVRANRRKFPKEELKLLPEPRKTSYKQLAVLLRLAVILNRSRSSARLPAFNLTAEGKHLLLSFPEGWLSRHPLTQADLEQETEYLKNADVKLSFQ